VLTHDLDSSAILAAAGATKPSVMRIRSENLNPDVVGEKIVGALWQMQVQLEAGALVSVEPHRTGMRLLPL
jgi:predicted nuclease of predicted toxin-antitoxin system